MNQAEHTPTPPPSTRVVPNPPPSHSSCRFAQMGTRAAEAVDAPVLGSLAGDILYGADAIAEFMYGTKDSRRTVYNLIQNKSIPHFRIGATVCARKSVLLGWIAGQETSSF